MPQKTSNPPAPPQPKLYGLDHLRTLAITFVFIYHYSRQFESPEWLISIGKFGWTGVDLFFVLSGYLISSQLFAGIARDEKISFPAFFLKRFFRIIPAYLTVVAVYFCFPATHEREALAPLWKYLSFTQNLGLDLRTQGTFSHAWSLCIEEQFYLLLPLILMALVYCKAIKKGYWLLSGLFMLGVVTRWYLYTAVVTPPAGGDINWAVWYKWIYYPTCSRLDGLLCGVALAALFQFKPLLKEKLAAYGNQFLLLSIVILTAAYFVCTAETSFAATVFGFPLISIGYGALVMGAICPGSLLYSFKSSVTASIATLSYALYLTHKIIIHLTQQQLLTPGIPKNSNRMLLLCLVTCLAGAWLMHKIIEQPFLKLRKKILAG